MPSSNERVVNRALSGTEMKELIRADFEKLLANEGLLSDYMAYGRVSWTITLKLHMDNYLNPESESQTSSRPEQPGVESFPLENTTGKDVRTAVEAKRTVTSPNQERIRAGMPVPVAVRQHDGTTTIEHVNYPKDVAEIKDNLVIDDVTKVAVEDWKKK